MGIVIMETTIIITECVNKYARKAQKYWTFKIDGKGRNIAEVDRYDGGYKIYSGEWTSEVGRRTGKGSALEFAKRCIREQLGDGVKFRWNVMKEVYKYI